MQTISDELKASLAKKNPTYKKVVELERRLYSAGAYVYDTAVDVTDQVKQYSPIRWKFDNESFNTWNLDNTSLAFRNDRNQWKQDNAKGYFPGNYLLNDSRIVIKFGAELADGTFEVLQSFTGYISGDPIANPSDKTVIVTIQGGMSIFEKTSAEGISTLVPDELLGEDAGDEFTTANNGVGVVVIIKRGVSLAAATEIRPITDYTLSDLNDKDLPLKITLKTALTAGEDLYISYRYWFQDKTLEWLVEEIMTLTGVASYSIAPAVFASSIENTWDFDSEADWNTCTKENIDTVTLPGSFKLGILDDFKDGDYTANPIWTVTSKGGSSAIDVVSSALNFRTEVFAGVFSSIKTPSTMALGSWQFRARVVDAGQDNYLAFWFMGESEIVGGIDNGTPGDGYYVGVSNIYEHGVRLKRADGTTLIDVDFFIGPNDIIRVSRTAVAGGTFELFINEVSKGTAIDASYNSSTAIYVVCQGYAIPNVEWLKDVYLWADGTTPGKGILTSPAHGAINDLSSWGKITATYTSNSSTTIIETSVWNGAGWDAWVAIDGTGQIMSTVYAATYIRFRVTGTLASLINPETPVFDQITIAYYTSTTVIDLVDLTGMTCKQVLERLAEMPAYEIGFKADETFVYRSRSTDVPAVIELRSDTNVTNLRNVSDGVERVKNRVVAEFGIYRKVSDASADAEPNSIRKYGTREYPVSSSSLLPAENVNIAYAIAPTILAYTKTPRRRCTVDAMFLPQLELGDKATLYFNEPTALRRWLWGDTDVVWGQPDLEYYDEDILANRYNFWGTTMRIEGGELNPDNFISSFDLVEVV